MAMLDTSAPSHAPYVAVALHSLSIMKKIYIPQRRRRGSLPPTVDNRHAYIYSAKKASSSSDTMMNAVVPLVPTRPPPRSSGRAQTKSLSAASTPEAGVPRVRREAGASKRHTVLLPQISVPNENNATTFITRTHDATICIRMIEQATRSAAKGRRGRAPSTVAIRRRARRVDGSGPRQLLWPGRALSLLAHVSAARDQRPHQAAAPSLGPVCPLSP